MFKPSRTASALMAAILLATQPATASLQTALEGMFTSNSTAAGVYQSQSRGGFVGGAVTARSPLRNINLVAFDRPRGNAGCGGIDLYGGSFSFINSDQLVALFRSVAANATGALFKIAIDAISPSIGKIMTEFQNKVQATNAMMRNSCELGTLIAQKGVDWASRDLAAVNETNTLSVAKGTVTDLFKALENFLPTPSKGIKENVDDCINCGNMVWKALVDSGAGDMLGNPAFDSLPSSESKEVIMSLLGTVIFPGLESANTNELPNPQGVIEPTIGLFDLRNGSGPSRVTVDELGISGAGRPQKKLLTCDRSGENAGDLGRNGCLMVKDSDTFVFEGTFGYTQTMLTGKDGAPGIVSKISSCRARDCGLTEEERRFIGSIDAPIIKLLRDVQGNKAAMSKVGELLTPVIADELALKFGEAALAVASRAFSGIKTVNKPPEITARQEQLFQELLALRNYTHDYMQRMNDATTYVAMIVKSNPAAMLTLRD